MLTHADDTKNTTALVQARDISRSFGEVQALSNVSLDLHERQIHALLGPNGAGKTTLVRTLAGLVEPSHGQLLFDGAPVDFTRRSARSNIGFVPSGDRSFYLRISGLENLIFFARLHGLTLRQARARAMACLDDVGLSDAAGRLVGLYSHGMQKRLSVARGLLMSPRVLLVDEATHDLDPDGAHQVKRLIAEVADRGTAVAWATQRIDEIRGFAGAVTVLHRGRVRFAGTVSQLTAHASSRAIVLRVSQPADTPLDARVRAVLGRRAIAAGQIDDEHVSVRLSDDAELGDALAALHQSGIRVLACRTEHSEIEEALLHLTGTETVA